MRTNPTLAALLAISIPTLVACAATPDVPGAGEESATEYPIIGGTDGSKHRDAVIVDGGAGACSGALIAPRVVLTAGHCIAGDSYEVFAPYAAFQKAHGSSGASYDGTEAKPSQHDVGLVFLDSDIGLDAYPAVATGPVDKDTSLVSVGRKKDGVMSSSDLYESPPYPAAFSDAWPNDYDIPKGVIEKSDSGGPVKIAGDTGTIVGVGSRTSPTQALLARVDQVSSWIAEQVAAHPGGGGGGTCTTCNGAPEDDLPSCGDLSVAWGLPTLCEHYGNGACGGTGAATWDCDFCCAE